MSTPIVLSTGTNQSCMDGGQYLIDGGTLTIDKNAGCWPHNSLSYVSLSVGENGGSVNINLSSGIMSGLSGTKTVVLQLDSTPKSPLHLNIKLYGPCEKIVCTYNGSVSEYVITAGTLLSSVNVRVEIPGNPFHLKPGGSLNIPLFDDQTTIRVPCYGKGTLILTPSGEIPVENIKVGDYVTILRREGLDHKKVIATSINHVSARGEKECLVKIEANAIGDNIPSQDLFVTPEHCLFFSCRFVPARMLVNGGSISYDCRKNFDVYHFELEEHSVVFANDVLSESYLDTGNRYPSADTGFTTVLISGSPKTWLNSAAAPLCTNEGFVYPIFSELLKRSKYLGHTHVERERHLSDDARLGLYTEEGNVLHPHRVQGNNHIFNFDFVPRKVWIKSRSASPTEIKGPYLDDRRKLGVLVGAISIFGPREMQRVSHHLSEEALSGWHHIEGSEYRWTDGFAELSFERLSLEAPFLLVLEVASNSVYLDEEVNQYGNLFGTPSLLDNSNTHRNK